MTYKKDLQLAFSGKEIASQRIEIIESTVFENEAAEDFSRERGVKYQKLLEKSNERIAEIKSRIADDIDVKQLQLDEYEKELAQVDARYTLGELSFGEHEKKRNVITKKYSKVEIEVTELQNLLNASGSSEIGGKIAIDIDKEVDESGNITMSASSNLKNLKISDIFRRRS